LTTRVQTLRSSTTGAVPAAGTRSPGELWTNFPDLQIGVIDAAKNPQKLVGVRYFSSTANYVSGDFVIQAGKLYSATTNVTAGTFNGTQWSQIAALTDIPAQYVLPTASTSVLGGVKIDGTTISIAGGAISVTAPYVPYVLPTASTSVLGGVKVDGTTVTIASGVISAAAKIATQDSPPTTPADNSLWWESSTGNLYLRYNDGNSAQWIQVNALPNSAGYVSKLGDTMTGGLTITKPYLVAGDDQVAISPSSAGGTLVSLNKTTGAYGNFIQGKTAGNLRWQIILGNSVAETGGNVGSDFFINRYNDAGANIDSTFSIVRSSGIATFSQKLQCNVGYVCKSGTGGALLTNVFNLNWASPNVQMWIDASNLGNITLSSDYRIKKDVAPLPSTWDRVKALKPISYTHQDYTPPNAPLKEDGSPPDPLILADDVERWGFIAHELQQTLIPDAATGFKDSPEHIQSPNPWTLIATLTKALQEAMQRIETLEIMMGAR
jgi:hypothetical protein